MDTLTIFDYYSESFQLPDGSYVNCEIMDTGGHEKFDSINRKYYQRADCCLLVYDITNKDSFRAIKTHYIDEIKNNCSEKIKVILLGNKTDLKDKRKISHKEGAKLAEKNNYMFMETSCETNYNVVDAFETLIIMTNNDMIKNETFKHKEKIKIKTFKLGNDNKIEIENENGEFEVFKDEKINKRKKNKKDKCC